MTKFVLCVAAFVVALFTAQPVRADITATDSFMVADGPVGSNWNCINGGLTIVSDSVEANSANSAFCYWSAVSFNNDQIALLTITHNGNQGQTGNGGLQAGLGVCVRMSGTSPANESGYCLVANDAGYYQWAEYNSGAGTFLGQIAQIPLPGDVMEVSAIGNTITFSVNYVQLAQITNGDLASGSAGIGASTGTLGANLTGDLTGANFFAGNTPITATQQTVTQMGQAIETIPFSVTVALTDSNGVRATNSSNVNFTLSLGAGSGALSGTLGGTIPSGSDAATVTNVIYSQIDTGVAINSTITSGDAFPVASTAPFNVSTSEVTSVTDDFASGALDSNWSMPSSPCPVSTGPGYYSANPSSGNSCGAVAIYTGASFHNDQYAQATLTSIAPFRSVVSITAVSCASGTATYSYTLTSGEPLIVPQAVLISGLSDSYDNGNFLTTSLGTGTFTVSNGNCVPISEQSGIGNSPSDSDILLVVRADSAGLNYYFCFIGTNSFSSNANTPDGRVYDHEIWKTVNGAGSSILASWGNLDAGPSQLLTAVPDAVGDTFRLSAVGDVISLAKKCSTCSDWLTLGAVIDTDITGGHPGIGGWSVAGPQEYEWANWGSLAPSVGNGAQQASNWIGSDYPVFPIPVGSAQPVTDSFVRADGGLGTNWTEVLPANGGLQISSNTVSQNCDAANLACPETYNAVIFPDNQSSQLTMSTTQATGILGPCVRCSTPNTGYWLAAHWYGPDGAQPHYSAVASFVSVNGNVYTYDLSSLFGGDYSVAASPGDVLQLLAVGPQIQLYLNGSLLAWKNDALVFSGQPGIYGASTAGAGGISAAPWIGAQFAPAVPAVNWTTPAAITYGMPLSAAQLDATVTPNLQGSFVYTPPAGTMLQAGTQNLAVVFSPTDTTDYASASGNTTITVQPAPLTIAANNAARLYGAANPPLAATVIGAVNGDNFTKTVSTAATPTSATGSYPITVSNVSGRDLADYHLTTSSGTLTISQAGTSVQMVTSANGSVADGMPVVFTASVIPSTSGMPTGTVTFRNGTASLGRVTLSKGTATITATLPSGSNGITAQYGGDANFTGSISAVETVAVRSRGGDPPYLPWDCLWRSFACCPLQARIANACGILSPWLPWR